MPGIIMIIKHYKTAMRMALCLLIPFLLSCDVDLYDQLFDSSLMTVRYDGNGSTGGDAPVDSTVYEKDQAVVVLDNTGVLVRDGYSFIGWNTASNGSGAAYTGGDMFIIVSFNLVLYAQWTPNDYTIAFDADGGSGTMASQTIPCDYTDNLTLNAFTNAGYTFAGWAMTSGGAVAYGDGFPFTMGPGNVTLYAQWDPIDYTITFDADGGSGTMTSQTIPCGSTAGLTTNAFTRAGYTFAGWATTSGGAVAYGDGDPYTMGAGNVTLYAQWSPIDYTITFDADGGSGSMTPQTIPCDGTDFLSLNAFTRVGYTFAGWAETSGGVVAYGDGDPYIMGAGDVTLYAQWIPNDYTVSFNADSGSGSMIPQTITFGDTDNLTLNAFTRTGYTFAGWAETSGGAVVYGDGDPYTMGAGDVTLYAQWIPSDYTVSFNADGGSGSMIPQTITFGDTDNLTLNAFTRTGYTFAGWAETSGGVVVYGDGASYTMGIGDVTLFAQWTANSYTVTFDSEGGTGPVPPSIVVTYDSAYGTLAASSKADNMFGGWWTGAGGTGTLIMSNTTVTTASNHTLYARWAPGRIAFDSNRDGNYQIYTMNTDGSNQNRLTFNSFNDRDPYWSTDGSKIVFQSDREGNWKLFVLNSDGSETRLTDTASDDTDPCWSLDGTKIAFTRNNKIWAMDADGSNQVQISNIGWNDSHPAWSADGSRIAFISNRNGSSIGYGCTQASIYSEVYAMNSGDGDDWGDLSCDSETSFNPAWSPDGTKIAYVRMTISDYHIWVMNTDGYNGSGHIMIHNSAGNYNDGSPAWSPDSAQVLFHSDSSGNYEIYVKNADGSGLATNLTNSANNDANPCWRYQYQIGDFGPGGGYVFYDRGFYSTDGNGTWRYLEAAPADLVPEMSMQWYNGTHITTGATGTAIGTGKSNTTAIIASQGPGIYAATICTDYSNNGYNDWFLPSLDEMVQMHDNLFVNGIGGLNWDYWTSTETSSTDAYYIFINTSSWFSLNKNMLRGVRAIRAF